MIYLNSTTQKQLDSIVTDVPGSLMMTGSFGVGLTGVIEYLTDKLGVTPDYVLPEKDEKVDIGKGTISVDSIRRLRLSTRLVTTTKHLVVIDYAERMGTQAQNAFLKLLEEPGENTHFILLSHTPSRLLPTVLSRVQTLDVRPISRQQSDELLDRLGVSEPTKRTQLLFIASGLPAELTRLATDQAYFEARSQTVRDARTLIQGSVFDGLKVAQAYKEDRAGALTLLTDAAKMLKRSDLTKQPATIKKLSLTLDCYDQIAANGNVRLQLARFVV